MITLQTKNLSPKILAQKQLKGYDRFRKTYTMEVSLPFSEVHVRHLPLKRGFDVIFALVALLVAFPLFITLALLIRLTSQGPIIYAHERIGRGGIPFKCFKFRTMYADAESRLKNILCTDPAAAKEWERARKLKFDPRITPLGKWLRKSSLDELPQFLNVLKGDLSVVGPRPVVRAEIEKYYREKAPKILSIRPGITGLWQVSGRSSTSYKERVTLDEHYVETHTLLFDFLLILKTISALLTRKGAY
jgi:undecaprenyl-phosphate galactose phosphotransferase